MHRTPYRATNDVTQPFNDGVARFYELTNDADAGDMPHYKATKRGVLPYETQRLGINRLYLSRQHQAEIVKVIRVARRNISPQDLVILEDGKRYLVDSIQDVMDVYPPSVDIALRRYEQNVEVLPR